MISELELPVLGRQEDAADGFAIIGAVKVVANDFSYRVLEEAAKGWFWSARRDKKDGDMPTYYGEHGLDEQRAYQIVCLMVGSDAVKFKALADETKLPEHRRRSCTWDFETAARSWERVIAPHRRAADQPKTQIAVSYGEAKGELGIYADWFVWPAPIAMEMRSCGEPGARWSVPWRKVHICYELAQEFAELYREYGRELKTSTRKQQIVAMPTPAGENDASRRERKSLHHHGSRQSLRTPIMKERAARSAALRL